VSLIEMIEVGIFDTGATDLPHHVTDAGIRVLDGSLADLHEAAQRLTVHQVRRAVIADRLGFDYFWMSEHHFNTEGSELSSNPLQSETAIAMLTKRLRLGQLANITAFHHPLRLAEQIAILDVLSGGRVEVGVGRGYQSREAETFGQAYGSTVQDQERNRSYHEEAVEILLKAWKEDSFYHQGDFYNLPPSYTKWNHSQTIAHFRELGMVDDVFRLGPPDMYSSGPQITNSTTTLKQLSVLPQPLQRPHPPMWEPVTSERSIRYAARNGFNGNHFNDTNKSLKLRIETYMDEAEKTGWPDYLDRGEFKFGWDADKHRGVSAGRVIHIVDKNIGNLDSARNATMFEWDFYKPFGFAAVLADPGEVPDINTDVTYELLREKGIVISGTTDEIVEGLLGLRDECYAEGDFIVNVWFEAGGLSHQYLEEQIQCFGEEVLPVLRRECGGSPERPAAGIADQILDGVDDLVPVTV
jgi:alkanesulfonate monooxygenase SsuD/methylene tetrahydromethanopterin reductase-like flavin-dependent oxidoreductase (luciferase family)